jgi:hypothetical protein
VMVDAVWAEQTVSRTRTMATSGYNLTPPIR